MDVSGQLHDSGTRESVLDTPYVDSVSTRLRLDAVENKKIFHCGESNMGINRIVARILEFNLLIRWLLI